MTKSCGMCGFLYFKDALAVWVCRSIRCKWCAKAPLDADETNTFGESNMSYASEEFWSNLDVDDRWNTSLSRRREAILCRTCVWTPGHWANSPPTRSDAPARPDMGHSWELGTKWVLVCNSQMCGLDLSKSTQISQPAFWCIHRHHHFSSLHLPLSIGEDAVRAHKLAWTASPWVARNSSVFSSKRSLCACLHKPVTPRCTGTQVIYWVYNLWDSKDNSFARAVWRHQKGWKKDARSYKIQNSAVYLCCQCCSAFRDIASRVSSCRRWSASVWFEDEVVIAAWCSSWRLLKCCEFGAYGRRSEPNM